MVRQDKNLLRKYKLTPFLLFSVQCKGVSLCRRYWCEAGINIIEE